MRTTLSLFLASITLSAAALSVACAAPSQEATDGEGAALSGTIGQATACAIEKAYQSASLDDFSPIYADASGVQVASFFQVSSVGTVVVVEKSASSGTASTFSVGGVVKAKAVTVGNHTTWELPTGAVLSCSGASYGDAGSTPQSDAGSWYPESDAGWEPNADAGSAPSYGDGWYDAG